MPHQGRGHRASRNTHLWLWWLNRSRTEQKNFFFNVKVFVIRIFRKEMIYRIQRRGLVSCFDISCWKMFTYRGGASRFKIHLRSLIQFFCATFCILFQKRSHFCGVARSLLSWWNTVLETLKWRNSTSGISSQSFIFFRPRHLYFYCSNSNKSKLRKKNTIRQKTTSIQICLGYHL